MEGSPITPPGNESSQPPQQAPTGEFSQKPAGTVTLEDVKQVTQSGIEAPEAVQETSKRVEDALKQNTPKAENIRRVMSKSIQPPRSMAEKYAAETTSALPDNVIAGRLAEIAVAMGLTPDEVTRVLATPVTSTTSIEEIAQNPGGAITQEDVKAVAQSGIEAPSTSNDTNTTNNT